MPSSPVTPAQDKSAAFDNTRAAIKDRNAVRLVGIDALRAAAERNKAEHPGFHLGAVGSIATPFLDKAQNNAAFGFNNPGQELAGEAASAVLPFGDWAELAREIGTSFHKANPQTLAAMRQHAADLGLKLDDAPPKKPLEGELTPFQATQAASNAGLDASISLHRRDAGLYPKNYWLNPLFPSGPLLEVGERMQRRLNAYQGTADSKAKIVATSLPLLSLYGVAAGGEERQRQLRDAYRRSGIRERYGDEQEKPAPREKAAGLFDAAESFRVGLRRTVGLQGPALSNTPTPGAKIKPPAGQAFVPQGPQRPLPRLGPGTGDYTVPEPETTPLRDRLFQSPKARPQRVISPATPPRPVPRGELPGQIARDMSPAGSARPVFKSTETLSDNVAPYYAKAPGGFSGAVDSAQRAMANRPNLPPHVRDRLARFSTWPSAAVDMPIHTYWEGGKGVLGGGAVTDPGGNTHAGASGLAYRGAPAIAVATPGTDPAAFAFRGGHPQTTLNHELTHAALQNPYDTPAGADKPLFPYHTPAMADPADDAAFREHWQYEGTPTELDPRLAEIKRYYTDATGRQVDTVDEANRAFEWYHNANGLERPGSPDSWGYFPEFYQRLKGQPEDRDALMHRMLELVRSGAAGIGLRGAA
jgi:hypothetical protein